MFRVLLFLLLATLPLKGAFASELHQSVKNSDATKTAQLLEQGAEPNAFGANGETALTQAILSKQGETVRLLLDHGASAGIGNAGGYLPLHAVAYAGDVETAQLILDQKVDVDDQDNRAGVSALSIASEEDNLDVARLLLSHGADFELADKNGYTPLTRAIWRGHGDMIVLLQEAGAKCQPVEILEEPAFTECLKGEQ